AVSTLSNGTSPDAVQRLARGLLDRLGGALPIGAGERATVVFDTGDRAWSLAFDPEGASLSTRRAPLADATLFAAPDVMADVVEGRASGVDAWLDGQLTMRGNIALALKLQGAVVADRPPRIPRTGTLAAHGIETFFVEAGTGPPVVLLHGLGATSAS